MAGTGSGRAVGWLVVVGLGASGAAHGATAVLVPVRDNTIYSENASRSNGAGEHVFAGRTADAATRRGLMAFNFSTIPAGSTITSASLEMYCSKAAPGSPPQNVRLHRLLASWGEAASDGGFEEGQGGPAQPGDATWTQRFFSLLTPWSPPGGAFAPAASVSSSIGAPGFFYTWSAPGMAADIQAWLAAPATNHGWLIAGNEATSTTVRRFGSRQNGVSLFWPRLTVNYTAPSVSVGATPDGADVPGEPLTIGRTGPSQIELNWGASCVASVDDYAVYQGSLGAFADHTPITCSTEGALTMTIPPPAASVFWLIVPVDPEGGAEGSYGTRSDGTERTPSEVACFPQSIGHETCPGH